MNGGMNQAFAKEDSFAMSKRNSETAAARASFNDLYKQAFGEQGNGGRKTFIQVGGGRYLTSSGKAISLKQAQGLSGGDADILIPSQRRVVRISTQPS